MEDLPTPDIFHNSALLALCFPFISEGLSIWQYVDGSSGSIFCLQLRLLCPFKTVSPVCSLGLLVGMPEIPTTGPHVVERSGVDVIRWSRLSGGL